MTPVWGIRRLRVDEASGAMAMEYGSAPVPAAHDLTAEEIAAAHAVLTGPCKHEWRRSLEYGLTYERSDQLQTVEAGVVKRSWFCVHCRLVEETSA